MPTPWVPDQVATQVRGRAAARCRSLDRSVSAARLPNPTCDFHRIRLSACSCRRGGACPWGRDAGSPVAVALDGNRLGPEELDVLRADLPAWEEPADQGVHVQSKVSFAQPADDAPEGVVVDVAERARGRPVTEIGAPAPQHRIDPAQQV